MLTIPGASRVDLGGIGEPSPKARPPVADVVAVALVDDLDDPRRVLAARRTSPSALAGQWEFPGGKVEPGETRRQAVHREIGEELGISIRLGQQLTGALPLGRWPLSPQHVLSAWLAESVDGQAQPRQDHDALAWLTADHLDDVSWLQGDLGVLELVRSILSRVRG